MSCRLMSAEAPSPPRQTLKGLAVSYFQAVKRLVRRRHQFRGDCCPLNYIGAHGALAPGIFAHDFSPLAHNNPRY